MKKVQPLEKKKGEGSAFFRTLEKRIGYRFKKKELLRAALTHPSFRYEHPEVPTDNQRLEFLGDSVLGLLAADALTKNNPDAAEGDLTQMRSALASGVALARMAAQIDLGSYLLMGRGEEANGGAERESNLEDALEALLGAIWLDGGLKASRKFFDRHVYRVLEEKEPALLNPKGVLQEYAQKRGFSIPAYRVVEESGPDHARHYTVEVSVAHCAYRGEGASRREAEKHAAEKAVECLV
jgi:ribonuclease-3